MNEAEIILFLLSKQKDKITVGATEEELLQGLGLTDQNAKSKLMNLLEELDKNILHLGLKIQFNIVNKHWYISFKDSNILANAYPPYNLSSKAAATLFSILILGITVGSPVKKSEIIKNRKKKNIEEDLLELESLGYIENHESTINLTPKVFYHVDIDELISEINKNMDRIENNKKSES